MSRIRTHKRIAPLDLSLYERLQSVCGDQGTAVFSGQLYSLPRHKEMSRAFSNAGYQSVSKRRRALSALKCSIITLAEVCQRSHVDIADI